MLKIKKKVILINELIEILLKEYVFKQTKSVFNKKKKKLGIPKSIIISVNKKILHT